MLRTIAFLAAVVVALASATLPVGATDGAEAVVEQATADSTTLADEVSPASDPITKPTPELKSEPTVAQTDVKNTTVAQAPPQVSSPAPSKAKQTVDKPVAPTAVSPAAASAPQAPQLVVPRDQVVVSAVQTVPGQGFTALELRNTSDRFVDLSAYAVQVNYSTIDNDYTCQVSLHNYLRPQAYVVLRRENTLVHCPAPGAGDLFDREAIVSHDGQVVEIVRMTAKELEKAPQAVWERKGWGSSNRTGVFAKDFQPRANGGLFVSGLYELPEEPPLEIVEILPNPVSCATADLLATCTKYVKIVNTSGHDVDLSKYRLRSGDKNTNDAAGNTSSLRGAVPKHGWLVVSAQADDSRLAINKSAGTVWLQDAEGLVNYPNTITPYQGGDSVSRTGRSWALNNETGQWQWATPSPNSLENNFVELAPGKGSVNGDKSPAPCKDGWYRSAETGHCRKITSNIDKRVPCKEGQYRSEETGRCRSIAAARTGKPCKEGQYRSEETGRCRSIALAATKTLKPCKDGYFRSPETNRCRKIASTDDMPKPCKEGWERNPETNRCRKIKTAAATSADYPVEPTQADASKQAVWWAAGGLALAGVGYAVWEWRRELGRGAGVLLQRIRIGRQK